MAIITTDTNIRAAIERKQFDLADSVYNAVANIGTNRDKGWHSYHRQNQFLTLDVHQLLAMYSEDWGSQRIIDILSDDMTREWRKFTDKTSKIPIDIIEREEKRLKLKTKVNLALKWAKLFGGSLIYMGIDGTGSLDTPLDLDRVKPGSLKVLNVVERPLIQIAQSDSNFTSFYNPTSNEYGEPEFFGFANGAFRVHNSRVAIFNGRSTPRFNTTYDHFFWGTSILSSVYKAIMNSQSSQDIVSSMLYKANLDVILSQGIRAKSMTPGGQQCIQDRLSQVTLNASINNAMVLDKDTEAYERQSINFSQLPEIMSNFIKILSAAAGIHSTRFLGESASGLSDTGENDLVNYYDRIKSDQEHELVDPLDKLDQVLIRSAIGSYPEDIEWNFNSLWQQDPTDKADIELKNAQRDLIYLQNGVISPDKIAINLQASKVYELSDEDIEEISEEVAFAPDPADVENVDEDNAEEEEVDNEE